MKPVPAGAGFVACGPQKKTKRAVSHLFSDEITARFSRWEFSSLFKSLEDGEVSEV
jgi:hypothetical protein